jgi:hypothetical protein
MSALSRIKLKELSDLRAETERLRNIERILREELDSSRAEIARVHGLLGKALSGKGES